MATIVGVILFVFWGGLLCVALKVRQEVKENNRQSQKALTKSEGLLQQNKAMVDAGTSIVTDATETILRLTEERDRYKRAYELSQVGLAAVAERVEKEQEATFFEEYLQPRDQEIEPPMIGISEREWRLNQKGSNDGSK